MRRFLALATFAALALGTRAARAQRSLPVEFGFDAAIQQFEFKSDHVPGSAHFTQIDVPVSTFRIAFPIDPTYSFEPAFSFHRSSGNGIASTNFNADLALLIHFTSDRRNAQWFFRPFLGWQHSSVSPDGGDDDRTSFGLGLGVKVPVNPRVAWRFEGRYRYLTKHEGAWGNVIGFFAGLSIYSH